VESLIVTVQQGSIRGYEITEPHAEAMAQVAYSGQVKLCTTLQDLVTYL